MTIGFAAALAAALALTGCDQFMPPAAGDDLDGEWTLVAGAHDGEPVPILDDAPITMTIEGNEIGGRAACNIYGGELQVDGEQIDIAAMSMTEMGCDGPVMEAEAAYVAALADVERWSRDRDRLTFTGEAVELIYEPVPATADADLVGTRWVLDSLVDGDAVSSTMGDEPATLTLRDDGTLTGFTGCRAFDGRYELGEGDVQVTRLVSDHHACPDLASQDEHVLAVMGDRFAYEIEGDGLTLSGGRLGLLYRAAEG